MSTNATDDRRLVELACDGDRVAFEKIVRRYQTLICSITYSRTGSLALSEDLAQETFLTAWRCLAQLRRPENLRGWLCGIARWTVANCHRAQSHRPASVSLDARTLESQAPDPSEVVMGGEEQALVWNTLRQLSETYREPLVLFYREGRSIRQVAADLALSEAAVKQRLSRGRRLLSEKLASLVESSLAETKPGKAFSAGVMAALPSLAPQAASAATAAAAGKGSSTAKTALLGGVGAALLGPVLGLLGAWSAVKVGTREARSAREQRLMVQAGWFVFGYIALLNLFIAAAYVLLGNTTPGITVAVLVLLSIAYVAGLVRFAVWVNRRQHQIRAETGTAVPPMTELAQMSRGKIAGILAGSIFGSVFWILFMSVGCGDWPTAAWISVISIGLFSAGTAVACRARSWFYRVSMAIVSGLGVLNLAVVNLRWPQWVAPFTGSASATMWFPPPVWALNLLLIGIFAMVLTSLVFKEVGTR